MKIVDVLYPDMSCCMCGGELPQGSKALVHPSMKGPRGGKKYAHSQCMGGAASNPSSGRPSRRKTLDLRALIQMPSHITMLGEKWILDPGESVNKSRLISGPRVYRPEDPYRDERLWIGEHPYEEPQGGDGPILVGWYDQEYTGGLIDWSIAAYQTPQSAVRAVNSGEWYRHYGGPGPDGS